MSAIILGRADYHRSVAKEARIQVRNRYYEDNPILNDQNATMLARPGLRRWLTDVGQGPIRGAYTQPGTFKEALFVVSDTNWYRIDLDGTVTLISNGLQGGGGGVSMAATSNIGDTPEFLFLADGRNLWVYVEDGYAKATISGTPADNDVERIGDIYYKFTSGSVDTGTPDGTAGNPWLVHRDVIDQKSWQAFGYAIGATGTAGTDYSTGLTAHPDVIAIALDNTAVTIQAIAVGAAGNGVVLNTTGAGTHWSDATTVGGGLSEVRTVETPDDIGAISVGYIASYVVVIPAQGFGINGRFWWINPGETVINPLNYATAERAPDPIYEVVVFGDQFWLPGQSTTEVWYFTGNQDAPVLRLQGVTFDRGTWEGTALQIKESMIIVDNDGGVFQISGGLKRISTPDVEERIREAIELQAFLGAL